MAKRNIDLQFRAKGLAELNREMAILKDSVNKNHTSLTKMSTSLQNVGNLFFSLKAALVAVSGVGLIKVLADYDKKLYDMSRNAKILGQDFLAMKKSMDEVNKTTRLSIPETQKFFQQMQDGQRGARLSAEATKNLAQTLSKEYGPSLEHISGAMSDLLTLQQKEVNILRKVNEGFAPGELAAYGATLMTVFGATDKEIGTLTRVAMAHRKEGDQLSDSEKKYRSLADTVQQLEKSSRDLMMNGLRPMADTLQSVADLASNAIDKLSNLAGTPFGKMVLTGGAIGAAGMGVAGLASAGKAAYGGIKGIGGAVLGGLGTAGRIFSGGAGAVGLRRRGTRARMPGRANRLGGAVATGAEGLAGAMGTMGLTPINGGIPVWIVGGGGAAGGLAETLGGGGTGKGTKGAKGVRGRALPGGARATGGLGRLGKLGRFARGASPIALIAGLAAEYGGGALAEAGHTRTGSALQAGGGIAGMAGTGAMLGGILGPLGAVVGGIVGAGWGLVDQWGNITKATDGLFSSEQKAKTAVEQKAEAEKKAAEEIASRGGVKAEDPTKLLAAAAFENMAKMAAQQLATQKGLGGGAREKFIKTSMEEFGEGRESAEFHKALMGVRASPGKQAKAMISAQQELGGRAAGANIGEVGNMLGKAMEARQLLQYKELNAQLEQTLKITQMLVKSNESIADFQLRIRGNVEGAMGLYAQNIKNIQEQKKEYQGIYNLIVEISKGYKASAQEEEVLKGHLEKEGYTAKQIEDMLKRRKGLSAAIAVHKEKIVGFDKQAVDQQHKMADALAFRTGIAEQETSLLESQLELTKAQYLGMGPYLDQVFQVDTARRNITANLEQELKLQQSIMQDAKKDNQLRYDAYQKSLTIQKKIADNERQRLEITKNLREGYLDAVQAFTNVEGAFSKFIIDRETGFGEAMRRGMAAAGYKTGAIGAGSGEALIKYGPGGSMQFRGAEEQRQLMKGYEAYSPFWPQMMGGAALEQEAGAGGILHGQAVARQTGARLSQTNFMTAEKAKAQFGAYGADTTAGRADIAGPGGIKTLNENMSNYVTEGINKSVLAGQTKIIADGQRQQVTEAKKPKETAEEKQSRDKEQQIENKIKDNEQKRDAILKNQHEEQQKQRQAEVERVKADAKRQYDQWDKYIKRTSYSKISSVQGPQVGIGVRAGRGPVGTPGLPWCQT